MIVETHSPEETLSFARKLGEKAVPGTIYTLDGDLGTGKTVFAKGLAEGLGITEAVNSPTFTIVQEYDGGRLPFYHFDVYRIEEPEEMEEVGYDDYFYGGGVCLIEWAELIRDIIPDNAIHVTIEKDMEKGFNYRRITIEDTGH
ncbi:MAG: tRNA (adenosine(37)-N6)-threonylcarbamoyltransferase complex ATPase subunit type 1 TsaE [Bilifractor sp.]